MNDLCPHLHIAHFPSAYSKTPDISATSRTAQSNIMEALLRQSRSMCPFLSKTSPATLRSLSTTTAAASHAPGAGSMSNLQVLGRRCPIMGKALAIQSARNGNTALAGAFGGVRAYHSRVNRAKLHSSAAKEAQVVQFEDVKVQQQGTIPYTCGTRMWLRHVRF